MDELGTGSVAVVDGSSAPFDDHGRLRAPLVDVEITVEDLVGQPLEDPSVGSPSAFAYYAVYVYAGENEFGFGPNNTSQTYLFGDVGLPRQCGHAARRPAG